MQIFLCLDESERARDREMLVRASVGALALVGYVKRILWLEILTFREKGGGLKSPTRFFSDLSRSRRFLRTAVVGIHPCLPLQLRE